jgi:hypothetical protein
MYAFHFHHFTLWVKFTPGVMVRELSTKYALKGVVGLRGYRLSYA